MVVHTSAKISGDRHCGSEDLMFLVDQVVSEDHLCRSSSRLVTILPSLMAISTVVPLPRDLARPRDQRDMRCNKQEPIRVSYYLA